MRRCGADEDDSSTAWVCGQQPVTNWDIWVYPSNSTFDWATGNAAAMVNERAGVYSQVRPCWPACAPVSTVIILCQQRHAIAGLDSRLAEPCAASRTAGCLHDNTARGKCTSMSCTCSHHSLLLLPLLVQDNVPEWPCKAGNECFRRDRWE